MINFETTHPDVGNIVFPTIGNKNLFHFSSALSSLRIHNHDLMA